MYRKPPHPIPGCRRVIGVDPSGGRASWGLAVLSRRGGVWSADEILELDPIEAPRRVLEESAGACVACIDAPITAWRKSTRGFRPHESASRRLGFRVLPLSFRGMGMLVKTGVVLGALLWEAGVYPCETHPSSAARIMGLAGVQGGRHAWEALVAAYVGVALVEGRVVVTCSREGCIVVPLGPSNL